MRFAYTRRGGPLLDWSGVTPPSPTRAGETRSLGDWYPTSRNSGALRRYGGRLALPNGNAIPYEKNRQLGYWGAQVAGHGGSGYHPVPGMGNLPIPIPGGPEIIEGYESPAPGAAVIHLGNTSGSRSSGGTYPWNEAYPGQTSLSGYMPEGAARTYGQTMLAADEPAKPQFDMGLVRKAGILASAYHGVKRNNGSIMWGLLWAAAAWAVFPMHGLIMPLVAVGQGFGRPKGSGGGLIGNPAKKTRKKRRRSLAKTRRRSKARTRRYPSYFSPKHGVYLNPGRRRRRRR